MTLTIEAIDIFKTAYENRYTWDENFPGYTTNLTLKQGNELYSANIKVNPDFTIEVTGIDDDKVLGSVNHQMWDLVTHRKRSSFEKTHGKNKFILGATDESGAVEILVEGESMGSHYHVRGDIISQVYRVMGPMAFTIHTHETLNTGSGYVATEYQAIFRDSKTNELKAQREIKETYDKFGDYYLPTCQIIESIEPEGQAIITEFHFSNITLL